jgi:2-polyprenyl-6-methoxyphenol hydroxylase-like FAD-dependent oxidoreductase
LKFSKNTLEVLMSKPLGDNAVVIGGSLAGLITARVLADHFELVTVLERDHIESTPGLRKSIPQGNHVHALQPGGQRAMAALYPNLFTNLVKLGSVRSRFGRDIVLYLPSGKAYSFSGTVREPRDLGIDLYCQSRGLLEHCVRECTLELPNVRFHGECTVQGLIYRHGRVDGVQCGDNGSSHALAADLVVDASGRGSRTPRWLSEMGFQPPAETTIGVDLAYASTHFRVPDDYDRRESLMAFDWPSPDSVNCERSANSAIMEIIEGDVWHLTLAGRFGDYPPREEEGFFAFAKSLHTPKLYELIKDAERVSDITTHRFPTSVRRHYESLPKLPEGFIVLGDAIASFNPVYGQGMSSAALQAQALGQLLAERPTHAEGLAGLPSSFFRKAAEVVDNPWVLSGNVDLAYAKTRGERPPDLKEKMTYLAALDALSADDAEVLQLFFEVLALCKPVSALNEEPLRSRVLAEQRKHPEKYGL